MKIGFPSVLLTLSLALLAGCAWVPQKVTIAPQLQNPTSQFGHGAKIVVAVRDIRPTQQIGYRGLDSKGAEITTDQDLASIFQKKIIEGLTQQGFLAVPSSDEPARALKVEIRSLEYKTEMEFWKGTVRARAALHANSKAEGAAYDQLYTAERQEPAVEAPRAKTNEQLINGAISDVLQKLLADPRLLKFLAN